MQGQILDFSIQSNSGIITSEGKRYSFAGSEWKENTAPQRGMMVDFEINKEDHAIGVYKALNTGFKLNGSAVSLGKKNKVVAGLLALFLGGFGAHKFYLKMPVPGIVYFIGSFVCIVLFNATEEDIFSVPWLIITIVSIVDAILYFTKSDEEFNRVYVEGGRQWF